MTNRGGGDLRAAGGRLCVRPGPGRCPDPIRIDDQVEGDYCLDFHFYRTQPFGNVRYYLFGPYKLVEWLALSTRGFVVNHLK